MNIEEKRIAIQQHCKKHWYEAHSCVGCPLYFPDDTKSCSGGDADIDENYNLIVGLQKTQPDMVNHPPHYETGKYDCIEVMVEAIGLEAVKGFCLCNAFKYIYRCTKKHETPVEDVKKAVWYLNKFLELGE